MHVHEDVIAPVIMHCRVSTPKTIEFRTKIGFNQYNITFPKEKSVLKSVMNAFEVENMQINTVYQAIELISIFMTIQRQKAIEKELGCEFIRINLDE